MRSIAIATAFVLGAAAAAAPALAASPFDGTWKTDVSTISLSSRPDVFAVAAGTYTCATCAPPRAYPADGAFHPIRDNPYIDEESIKVVDATTLFAAARLHGKPAGSLTYTVSADGNTLTEAYTGVNAATGATTHFSDTRTRVAAALPGAHAASGSWQQTKIVGASDNSLTMTVKLTGKTFRSDSPTGQTLIATIGGPAVKTSNDPTGILTAVTMPAPDTILLTDIKDGKVIDTFQVKLAADGKSALATSDDKRHGEVSTFTMLRQ